MARFCLFLFFAAFPLRAQDSAPALPADAASLVGLRLEELVARFGVPKTVHASRGQSPWQDDVVFVYDAGDFFIYKDRVWQVSPKNAYGISVGDSRSAVILWLGDRVVDADTGDYVLLSLPSGGWPLKLRVNFNAADKVSAIYIYRGDY